MVVELDPTNRSTLPCILGEHTFLIAYSRNLERHETFIVLYEFDESHPSLEPRKLRTFQLPVVRKDFTIHAINLMLRPMTPTYPGVETRFESHASHSIYSDRELLCAIIFRVSPPSHTICIYNFLAYSSTFLSSDYGGIHDVPWESWVLDVLRVSSQPTWKHNITPVVTDLLSLIRRG